MQGVQDVLGLRRRPDHTDAQPPVLDLLVVGGGEAGCERSFSISSGAVISVGV